MNFFNQTLSIPYQKQQEKKTIPIQFKMESPPSIVTVTVPVTQPEGTYTYVAVKGSLHASDSAVFGLNSDEVKALSKRFSNSTTEIVNGVNIKGPPMSVINALSLLGYKVVGSTGEIEIVWTLQREV